MNVQGEEIFYVVIMEIVMLRVENVNVILIGKVIVIVVVVYLDGVEWIVLQYWQYCRYWCVLCFLEDILLILMMFILIFLELVSFGLLRVIVLVDNLGKCFVIMVKFVV